MIDSRYKKPMGFQMVQPETKEELEAEAARLEKLAEDSFVKAAVIRDRLLGM